MNQQFQALNEQLQSTSQKLKECQEERDLLQAQLDHRQTPLKNCVEPFKDKDDTIYIHHPKCVGYCDYCCGGVFVEHVQLVRDEREPIYGPVTLQSQLASTSQQLTAAQNKYEQAAATMRNGWDQIQSLQQRNTELETALRTYQYRTERGLKPTSSNYVRCVSCLATASIPERVMHDDDCKLQQLLTPISEPVQSSAQVAGEYMMRSIADFNRAVEALLAEEQERPNPNNALVAVLCDAIRLSRENVRLATGRPVQSEASAKERQ